MKKIVCELCDCTEFVKDNGVFICQGCGTKYSIEEAKSMMKEIEGEAPASTGAPAGLPVMPQANPNQQQLENILILAASAQDAGNNAEAESYCNQAITIDATAYRAWFLKGKAVGWQSSMANIRIEEAAHSFCKAIDFAPVEEKDELKNQALEELKRLGLALISLRKDRFANSPDDEELAGFINDKTVLLKAILVLVQSGYFVGIPEGYEEEIANLMNQAGVAAVNNLRKKWNSIEYPNHSTWKDYISRLSNIEKVIRLAIDASDKDDEEDITRYENLIIVLKEPIGSCSYKDQWSDWQSKYVKVKEYSLSDDAIKARNKEVRECEDAIAKIKQKKRDAEEAERRKAEEEKKKRVDAYWEAHAEEKAKLEAESKQLYDKIPALRQQINDLQKEIDKKFNEIIGAKTSSEDELDKVSSQIRNLRNERSGLGVFAGGRKKEIDNEISALEGRMISLKDKAQEEKKEAAVNAENEVAPLKTKKANLTNEMNEAQKRQDEINSRLNNPVD